MKNHNGYPGSQSEIKWAITPDGEIDWDRNPVKNLEGSDLDSLDAVGEFYRDKATKKIGELSVSTNVAEPSVESGIDS